VIRVGTAGWTIPCRVAEHFPSPGSGLERYTARFNCAEINSTFYRPHKPATFERWAASVPEHFRFAVKVPRAITHERRLVGPELLLDDFLSQVSPLGAKLGPLLVQLPPSLVLDANIAAGFFGAVRQRFDGRLVCEPRHASWFTPEADALLQQGRIARVAANPARVPEAAQPGGWPGLVYHRLHGSARIYYSEYGADVIEALADQLGSAGREAWCIFDNTVSGAAAANALALIERLSA